MHPYTIINTNATQVAHQNPSSPKAKRPLESIKHALDSNHAQINSYLQCSTPSMPEVDVGSRLIDGVASMNHLWPPIQNSSTHQII